MSADANNVLVFFQADRAADRTVPQLSKESQLPAAKRVGADGDPALLVPLCETGELIMLALGAAHLTVAAAAEKMGIPGTLLSRQLRNLDNQHVSLQRLYRLPDPFWRELMVLIAVRRKLARVRRRMVFDFDVAM